MQRALPIAEVAGRPAAPARRLGEKGGLARNAAAGPDLRWRIEAMEEEIARLRGEQAELRRALSEAGQMQRRLCGPRRLRRGAFEIVGELFPAEHLSGDFLVLFDEGEELVLAIGDIAGKGLSAGLWFTHIVGMIRLLATAEEDPARVLAAINRELARVDMESAMTTVFLARLDWRSGSLVYANAGHPPALLLGASGEARTLETGGPLLGALAAANYESDEIVFGPSDLLLGYSDGVAERSNESGMEFGIERLRAAAENCRDTGASRTLFSILGAVADFAANRKPQDDLALLVIHRRGDTFGGKEGSGNSARV